MALHEYRPVGAPPKDIEGHTTKGLDGQVPKANAVGGIDMEDETGGGEWTAESGSPYTATGTNSINPSGLDEFDIYKATIQTVDNASSTNNTDLQINGDTGTNYNKIDRNAASESTGNSEIQSLDIHVGDSTTDIVLIIMETHEGIGAFSKTGTSNEKATLAGAATGVSMPLTQFTLKRGASTDWTVELKGRNFE